MWNKNTFLYQAGLLALSNSALMLLAFMYRIILGRLAGAEGLGVYTLVMQVYTILMSISVYGMCVAVTHMAASLHAKGDMQGLRKLMRTALLWFFSLYALLSLPTLLFRDMIAGGILGDARTADALMLILLCVLLTGVENIIKAMLYGLRLVKFNALSEVGEQILRIVFAFVLLTLFMNGDHGRTAFLILLAMTISELYSVAILGLTYYKKIIQNSRGARVKTTHIRLRFIKLALPSTLTSILGNVFASVTVMLFPARLMVAGYTRSQAVSALGVISGMIMPVLLLPSALINALCTLLMPSIADCVSRGNHSELRNKVNKGIEVTGLMGIPAMLVLLPFVSIISALVFGESAPFALIFLLTLEMLVTFYIILINSILNGLGRQKHVLMLTAAREAVQLSLVWLLTAMPAFHIYGYALGLLCGDILHVALGLIYVHGLTHTRPRLFHAFLTPAACAAVLYLTARMLFFLVLKAGGGVIAAMLASLAVCILLYMLMLRMLGVRVAQYFKRTALTSAAIK